MNKKDIIRALETIAIYLELKGENSFKISAYRRAANVLEQDDRSLEQLEDVTKLKGIGKGTASVIIELIETGRSELLEDLKASIPEGLIPMLKLPGLGGKKLAKLYQELGVTRLEDLKDALQNGAVQKLEGFGPTSEAKLLKAIEEWATRPDRLPIAYMLRLADAIESELLSIDEIERFSRAGSLRRLRETMKDLDFVIATRDPKAVTVALQKNLKIKELTGSGDTKMSIVLGDEYQTGVDFRFVEPPAFATGLHHFTGSKDHNVLMRRLAKARGEKISEYGVEQEDGSLLTFEDEKGFFNHFGLAWISPECREGKEELDRATGKQELAWLEENQIKSDLHMHTTWSDGAHSLDEMVQAAIRKGYDYIVITDHSQSLRVANGLTAERLYEQRKQINALNDQYKGTIQVFAGVEMDLLPDGSLDYEDEVLDTLDFVIGAIHSAFSQDERTIMKRLKTAMEHPKVRLIAHPTGRVIGRRPGYKVNPDELFKMAAETGTALELNANPNRLDLSADWLAQAKEYGVRFCINTDAHSIDGLDDMSVGVQAARKAWLTSSDIINTYSLEQFQTWLENKTSQFV